MIESLSSALGQKVETANGRAPAEDTEAVPGTRDTEALARVIKLQIPRCEPVSPSSCLSIRSSVDGNTRGQRSRAVPPRPAVPVSRGRPRMTALLVDLLFLPPGVRAHSPDSHPIS
jgi:hypothetical protein